MCIPTYVYAKNHQGGNLENEMDLEKGSSNGSPHNYDKGLLRAWHLPGAD